MERTNTSIPTVNHAFKMHNKQYLKMDPVTATMLHSFHTCPRATVHQPRRCAFEIRRSNACRLQATTVLQIRNARPHLQTDKAISFVFFSHQIGFATYFGQQNQNIKYMYAPESILFPLSEQARDCSSFPSTSWLASRRKKCSPIRCRNSKPLS